jgi:hypothetical protein
VSHLFFRSYAPLDAAMNELVQTYDNAHLLGENLNALDIYYANVREHTTWHEA